MAQEARVQTHLRDCPACRIQWEAVSADAFRFDWPCATARFPPRKQTGSRCRRKSLTVPEYAPAAWRSVVASRRLPRRSHRRSDVSVGLEPQQPFWRFGCLLIGNGLPVARDAEEHRYAEAMQICVRGPFTTNCIRLNSPPLAQIRRCWRVQSLSLCRNVHNPKHRAFQRDEGTAARQCGGIATSPKFS